MDGEPKSRPLRFGLWLGGMYVFLATALFILTALTTKPGNVGLDWIPFMILTAPWSGMDTRLAIAGVLLNGVILWGFGNLLQVFFRNRRG